MKPARFDEGLAAFEKDFGVFPKAVSRLIRPSFVARPGHTLVWGDWSSIEARVLPWLAGEPGEQTLDLFRANDADPDAPDVYEVEAGGIYEKHPSDIDKAERQVGKVSCIAEGQLVLTDRGLVPIEKITKIDRVWDGIEWVDHDGVVLRGFGYVHEYEGLMATYHHLVWTSNGFQAPLGICIVNGWHLARTGDAGTHLLAPHGSDTTHPPPERPPCSGPVHETLFTGDVVARTIKRHTRARALLRAHRKGKAQLYDIVNAGPRNRFTVSNVLVHNCLALGFGGGVGALDAMATNYGIVLDMKLRRFIVDRWRANNQWAVNFWAELQAAFTNAWDHPGTVYAAGRVAYVFLPDYLFGTMLCFLPDGRPLCYSDLRRERLKVENDDTGEMEYVWKIRYQKGYERGSLWHGILCLGQDTEVLTNTGWKRIVEVGPDDLLWDGEEWIAHDGLCYQGDKHTMPVDGVHMTPDHEVLTDSGWKKAQDQERFHRADVRLPNCFTPRPVGGARAVGTVVGAMRLRGRVVMPFGWLDTQKSKTNAFVLRMYDRASADILKRYARNVASPGVRRLAFDAGSLPPADAPSMAQLWWAGHRGLRSLAKGLRRLLARHGADIRTRVDLGPTEQQRQLHVGELPVGNAQNTSQKPTRQSARRCSRDIEIAGCSAQHSVLSLRAEPVYDLVNAGPRRRFVVRGDGAPFIVHNCENITQGYAASLLRALLVRLRPQANVVGHTHDEVIQEVLEGRSDEAQMALKAEMDFVPDHAAGLPLAAKTSCSWYYSKSV